MDEYLKSISFFLVEIILHAEENILKIFFYVSWLYIWN